MRGQVDSPALPTRSRCARALGALPLLVALFVTPMLARPLTNALARYRLPKLGYVYNLDAHSCG